MASDSTTTSSSTTNSQAGLRHRRVVSSFLTTGRPRTSSFRLALFLRSSKVRTYPGLWAACSGSVEPTDASPRAAALREVKEETGLGESDLELLSEGESFELIDEELSTRWEIRAFIWGWKGDGTLESGVAGNDKATTEDGQADEVAERLKQRITLDWEHDEVRFVKVEDVKGMKTVDNLSKSIDVALASIK